MSLLCNDIRIEILILCKINDIINFSLINKKIYKNFNYIKQYIGIKKIKNLKSFCKFKFKKECNFDYFDILQKILKYGLHKGTYYSRLNRYLRIFDFNILIRNCSIKGYLNVINFLFNNNIIINDLYNNTIRLCIEYDQIIIIKFILDKKLYSKYIRPYYYESLLDSSIRKGNLDIIKLLMKHINFIINNELLQNSIIKEQFIIAKFLINNGYTIIPSNIYDVCKTCIIKNDIEFFKFISDNYHYLINNKLLLKNVLSICTDYNNLEFIKFIFQNYLIDIKTCIFIRDSFKKSKNKKLKNILNYLNNLVI